MNFEEIIAFWFDEAGEARWWGKDVQFDAMIRERFGAVHAAAARCETFRFRGSMLGRLAEIIVLDQFSRNMFRRTRRAFEQDTLALCLAQEAVAAGAASKLAGDQLAFLCMPFMHAESKVIQAASVEVFAAPSLQGYLSYAQDHRQIIDTYGRFPHRNEALERTSTPAELEFLRERADF